MGIFDYFRQPRQKSANVAKERLQIIVARERAARSGPDYLPAMQQELLQVIRKYVEVDDDAVQMNVDREGDCEVLELNITLPDHEDGTG
ncbi:MULTISPECIES: cell division topological specificity factor MinE [Thioalkalivibrio]|uniref:Cell division topological specificity factor n=1 Tax=Thioalkalivibrio halophilus TaxID=252474 RepID=A0A1V2ZYG6_9GAMM|nr:MULTISPECIES: cell division topological specificity factor MinE [Thioalkalivibrio]OOC10115.1 cell division topological specificity factor MinE [Thioalkalivibrio halophilus]PYG02722.1 cell division topological specificity factor MinE [Thioalkalivibrio sp. ALE21]